MKIMQSSNGKGAFSLFEAISWADIAFKAQKAPFLIRFLTLIWKHWGISKCAFLNEWTRDFIIFEKRSIYNRLKI